MKLIAMGEAARRIGVYPDTLKNWEKRGLVMPMRDTTGRRLFTSEQIEELTQKRMNSNRS